MAQELNEDFKETLTVDEITENDDGTATVRMTMSDEAQKLLIKEGLRYLIEEMKMHDKVVVIEPNEFSGSAKKWELSDDDRNALFHFGFISAIRKGIKESTFG